MSEQKSNITNLACGIFKQLGFKSVTMDDISRQCGVSKKTLYELYKDKDELVLESVKYMLTSNQCEIECLFASSKNAIEQVVGILNKMESMIRGMNPVCYVDLQRYYQDAYQYLQNHKEEVLYQSITQNLNQGIQEGLYRSEIDVEIMTRFKMESAMLVFQQNVFPSDKFNSIQVNYQIFAHFMYGLATPKGYKLIEKYLSKYFKTN